MASWFTRMYSWPWQGTCRYKINDMNGLQLVIDYLSFDCLKLIYYEDTLPLMSK